MDKKINFLHTCRKAAAEAEKLFGINARIILAQGALESGWGSSCLATEHHNFFGLMGYGASNAYWHGQRATFETAYGTHHFRHYEATRLSFLDFARLIRSAYPRAYHFSFQPEAYAKEIAYSPYISEQNGDNRDLYRRNIIALEADIGRLLDWEGAGSARPESARPILAALKYKTIPRNGGKGGQTPPLPGGPRPNGYQLSNT